MQTLMEKIAAKKPRKKKPAGGRKPKDTYAPDMSGGAPGTKAKPKGQKVFKDKDFKSDKPKAEKKPLKPKEDLTSKSNSFKADKPKAKAKMPTLHEKVDKLMSSSARANKPKPKPKKHIAKKIGLVAAGVAGGSALVHKVRQNRMSEEG